MEKFNVQNPYTRMKILLKQKGIEKAVFKFVDNMDGNGIQLAYFNCGDCEDGKCEICKELPTNEDLKKITETEIRNFDIESDDLLKKLKKYLKPECFN